MEIVIKTILRQIFTQCAGTQDIIKKLASCGPCRRKSGFKTVAFLLRLSIHHSEINTFHNVCKSKISFTELYEFIQHIYVCQFNFV